MKTVIIKRSGWGKQALRNSGSKRKCCLGFCAVEAGLKYITDRSYVTKGEGFSPEEMKKFKAKFPMLSDNVQGKLGNINDADNVPRAQKEIMLNGIVNPLGLNFKFV